jgi:hypothetical protein
LRRQILSPEWFAIFMQFCYNCIISAIYHSLHKFCKMHIILMADIVKSSKGNAKALMKAFSLAVHSVNNQNRKQILSPLTITLGDKFQGVVRNMQAALQVIFDLEQQCMTAATPFKLRYMIVEGDILTAINKENAHAMLGPGLTEARERLGAMKSTRTRFQAKINDESTNEDLNLMFVILQGIVDQWTQAQQKVVSAFLRFGDYRTVAEKLKKDPSVAWKREKSLMIAEYHAIQKLMMKTVAAK